MLHVALVGDPEPIEIARPAELADWYVLSPYVIKEPSGYTMLVRMVNRDDVAANKISRIYCATSNDGVHFTLGEQVIAPGGPATPDDAGCEDPTVVHDDGDYSVFYSGFARETGMSLLLCAHGATLGQLEKRGSLLSGETYANNKEAAIIRTPHGVRLFFEYAADQASHIGVADAQTLAGPWLYGSSALQRRPTGFDSFHLSPSSAVRLADGTNVLFYNGATADAQWRVAWAHLDADASHVLERPAEPLIVPFGRRGDDRDMVFAASSPVIAEDQVALYYSVSDQYLYRSVVSVEGARSDATAPLRLLS